MRNILCDIYKCLKAFFVDIVDNDGCENYGKLQSAGILNNLLKYIKHTWRYL